MAEAKHESKAATHAPTAPKEAAAKSSNWGSVQAEARKGFEALTNPTTPKHEKLHTWIKLVGTIGEHMPKEPPAAEEGKPNPFKEEFHEIAANKKSASTLMSEIDQGIQNKIPDGAIQAKLLALLEKLGPQVGPFLPTMF